MTIPYWTSRSLLRRPREQWADATVMLGGGGARGLAHLGALRALGHSGIGVGRLVGVSMGALMAALCAVERDVERAEIISRDFLESDRYRALQTKVMGAASGPSGQVDAEASWARRWRNLIWATKAIGRAAASESLMTSRVLESITAELLPDINIEDLRTPLHLIAVDLAAGERVVISEGNLRRTVVASMSIPGVFPSVEIDGRKLGDVGVYDAVPCDVARDLMKAKSGEEQTEGELIVVDVSRSASESVECDTALEAMLRVQELAEMRIRERQLKLADVVVRPDVGAAPWYDFTNPDPLISAGYEAVLEALQEKKASESRVGPKGPQDGDRKSSGLMV